MKYKLLKDIYNIPRGTVFDFTLKPCSIFRTADIGAFADYDKNVNELLESVKDDPKFFLATPDEPVSVYDRNWRPKINEKYFFVEHGLNIEWRINHDNPSIISFGKVFPTRELASKWLEVLKFRREFEDWYYETVGDWKPDSNGWRTQYCIITLYNKLKVDAYTTNVNYFCYTFPKEDQVQSAIDKFGDKLFMLSPDYDVYDKN